MVQYILEILCKEAWW